MSRVEKTSIPVDSDRATTCCDPPTRRQRLACSGVLTLMVDEMTRMTYGKHVFLPTVYFNTMAPMLR